MFRRFFRWLLITGWIARLSQHATLNTWLPVLVGFYFLTLDVWGDDLYYIREFRWYHQCLFFFCITVALASLTLRGLRDSWFPEFPGPYRRVVERLIASVGKIITAKGDRFRKKLPHVTATGNVFDLITKPDEQIEIIIDHAHQYFCDILQLKPENFDVTIIYFNHDASKWDYLAKTSSNSAGHSDRTSAQTIMEKKSVARDCHQIGMAKLLPDKLSAKRCGEYFETARDTRFKCEGSVFCRPISVDCCGGTDHYVVTFSTYGERICQSDDEKAIESFWFLFFEFTRRIEIEIILHSIKTTRQRLNRFKKNGS